MGERARVRHARHPTNDSAAAAYLRINDVGGWRGGRRDGDSYNASDARHRWPHAADAYAFGSLMFTVMTGNYPWQQPLHAWHSVLRGERFNVSDGNEGAALELWHAALRGERQHPRVSCRLTMLGARWCRRGHLLA